MNTHRSLVGKMVALILIARTVALVVREAFLTQRLPDGCIKLKM